MPVYEYRCKVCDGRFELRRAIAEADAPASCAAGHDGAVRLLSVFAATGRATATASAPAAPCGGSCACAPGA